MQDDHPAKRHWLRLATARGLSPLVARKLAGALGGPGALLNTPVSQLAELGAAAGIVDALAGIGAQDEVPALEWLDSGPGRHLLCVEDRSYPPLLAQLPDAPVVLLVEGSTEALGLPQLAVVGSRNPTASGTDTADAFAFALARAGLAITSGLARGIDAAAHGAALRAGAATVAVFGHGPDRVYPREHQGLARAIVEGGGALVTEFMPGRPPERSNFPRRNRIISGLCRGVLVVEAAVRSGSLSTARSALEQGREVFAIPGSIHNPMARGCHRLIRQGAKLVETTQDVLEELQFPASSGLAPAVAPDPLEPVDVRFDDDYVTLLSALGYDPVSVDTLVQRTGLTPQALSSMLLNLQMKGLVGPVSGGCYMRRAEG